MQAALAQLQEELGRHGWLLADRGAHPWSQRYVRPRVDWSRPLTA